VSLKGLVQPLVRLSNQHDQLKRRTAFLASATLPLSPPVSADIRQRNAPADVSKLLTQHRDNVRRLLAVDSEANREDFRRWLGSERLSQTAPADACKLVAAAGVQQWDRCKSWKAQCCEEMKLLTPLLGAVMLRLSQLAQLESSTEFGAGLVVDTAYNGNEARHRDQDAKESKSSAASASDRDGKEAKSSRKRSEHPGDDGDTSSESQPARKRARTGAPDSPGSTGGAASARAEGKGDELEAKRTPASAQAMDETTDELPSASGAAGSAKGAATAEGKRQESKAAAVTSESVVGGAGSAAAKIEKKEQPGSAAESKTLAIDPLQPVLTQLRARLLASNSIRTELINCLAQGSSTVQV
jgi:hypothetical protein